MDKMINEYRILSTILNEADFYLYHGLNNKRNTPCFLKVWKSEHPSIEDLAEIKKEYLLLKNLNSKYVSSALDLQKYGNSLIIELETFEGIPLKTYELSQTIDTHAFFNIAIQLVETLIDLFKQQIVLREFSPESIYINPDSQSIKLIDLGDPNEPVNHYIEKIKNNINLLNYISPELTGRMTRVIDYRSNIYSLGVVLYEMLTHTLPFHHKDPMAIIHNHIAKVPVPPVEINANIPKPLSDIILFCLQKIPEERYQSLFGLKSDLESCLRQYKKTGTFDPNFKAGQSDVERLFNLSPKLYGKAKQIAHFKEMYERVSRGSAEWLLIAGEHGLGRTVFINEINAMPSPPSLVARGMYEPTKQHIPLSGLIQAFTQLINNRLKESQEQIDILHRSLSATLRENGQLIIELIPELEFIIGKQPHVTKLTLDESRRRLSRVFLDFIKVFISPEHPLMLILEDLQLADQASLDIIKDLFTDTKISHLLIVSSYSSEKVDYNHAITRLIGDVKQENRIVEVMELTPLDLAAVNEFVADSLNTDKKNVIKLAELLFNKTNGNPYFVAQLLKKLHEEGHIKFNPEKQEWEWELEKLKRLEFSKNVVDLMIQNIKQFSVETQRTLSFAAAIGLKCDLELMAKASFLTPNIVLKDLLPAIKSDLIRPSIDLLQIEPLIEQREGQVADFIAKNPVVFEFANERVRQASDALISDEEKIKQHYQIGKYLFEENKNKGELTDDALYFNLLSHLNLSRSIITDPSERLHLAKMNLNGGYMAKNSTAYALALDLFTVARELLPKDSWIKHYDLTFPIYLESTDCSLLQKKFDDVEILSKEILEHARNNLDKGKLYLIKMEYYINITHYSKAIDIGINCAKLFGVKIPIKPSKIQILLKLLKLRWLLGSRTVSDLDKLPPAKDEEVKFLQQLYFNIGVPAYLTNRQLAAYISFENLIHILKNGYCEGAAITFATYGVITISLFSTYKASLAWNQFAIDFAERYESHIVCCRVYFFMLILTGHWTLPFSELKEILQKCYQHGLYAGDLFYLSYITVFFGFGDGTYLSDLKEANNRLQKYTGILHSIKNQQAMQSYKLRTNFLRVLMTPSYRGLSMSSADFDEDEFYFLIRNNTQNKQVHQGYVAYKLMILYLFGLYEAGLKLYEESKDTREAVVGFMTEKDQLFYITMHKIAMYPTYDFWQRIKFKRTLKKSLARLKHWAEICPSSNSHRPVLVEAEVARVYGQTDLAQTLYDHAIKLAEKNNFVGELAMANELAGRLHLELGKVPTAKVYIREAHYNYYLWGALSKSSQLAEKYPEFIESDMKAQEEHALTPQERSSDSFDIEAVIRASAVLSKEIHLDKLLGEVLQLLIVEAGADRAIFIMEQDGSWVIQGERRSRQEESKVLQALPVDSSPDLLPVSLVNYVLRTKEKVLINDTSDPGMFNRDPYLVDHKIKSTLCLPIISQGKMSAVLYLENSLSKHVFSPEKIKILELLSTQIASSIENSILYNQLAQYNKNLENKVQERTVELQDKNEELANTLGELKKTQDQLVESGKLAALGQLIAGITHEINTPLGATRASSQNSNEAIKAVIAKLPTIITKNSGEKLNIMLDIISKATAVKPNQSSSREERALKRKMITSLEEQQIPHADELVDLMADMGIYEDLSTQLKALEDEALEDMNFAFNISALFKNNQNIMTAIERASKIIFALKTYMHQGDSEAMQPANIIEGLESVLTLYQHQLKQNIQLEKRFEDIPLIPCRINELNQVWTNLIQNALHSMNNNGSIEINVFKRDGSVVVQVIDSGAGVNEEVKKKIFTPFFTTKARGEGSGLGLSISKKIIEAHGGSITFESNPGRTMFSVVLPISA